MATTDKYDRQLRLWGASGQRALGNTLVVLVGSSACGTETLKNLVLPGIGSFLVLDDDDDENIAAVGSNSSDGVKIQSSPDLTDSMLKFASSSSNFFLSPPTSSSQDGDGNKKLSNAAKASALLSELNPDVRGYHYAVPSLEDVDYQSFLETLMANPPSSSDNGSSVASPQQKILVISADQPSTGKKFVGLLCYLFSSFCSYSSFSNLCNY